MDELARVLEQIDQVELTEFLQGAIQIPSTIETEDEETEVAHFIAKFMQDAGIETELQIVEGKRPNVISTLRGSGQAPSVTYNGHIDTVPAFDMQDAFSGKIENGEMWGRGASDMKSGIIAMAYALVAIKRSGITPPGDVVLSAVVGEEYGSYGARHYVANSPLTDYGICGEPTNLRIGTAQKGLHWYEFHFPGKRIHSSVSSQGVNAIKRVNKFINAIETDLEPKLAERKHPLLGPSLINLGKIWGGEQPNVVPGDTWLQLERRYIPGETRATVEAELDELIKKIDLEDPQFGITYESMPYSLRVSKTPLDIPEEHPIVQATKDAFKVLDMDSEIMGVPYWGDAGVLNDAGVDCILFGPGRISDAHSPTERVVVDDVVTAAKVYALIPFFLKK